MKKLGKLKKLMGVVLAMAMTVSSLPAREKVSADEGYTATFVVSGGSATIDVYYTQDYTAASETNVTTAVARNGDTGEVDTSGSGQINFKVNVPSGYAIDTVTATTGTYKNMKTPADTGVSGVYRMTKVTADTTVTITLTEEHEEEQADTTTFKFTDSGIAQVVTGDTSTYKIGTTDIYDTDGTTVLKSISTLSIKASGVYKITGEASEGIIEVKKNVTDVVLILSDLTLSCSWSAPVQIGKSAQATVHIDGDVVLNDNEVAANETSTNTSIADAYEGAAIKVKKPVTDDDGNITGSNTSLTLCGDEDATLTVNGNCKNGIKGGVNADITVNCSNYFINAVNNGLASDGTLTINGGKFAIVSGNDAIKSVPDEDDTTSQGVLTINGGTFDIDATGDGISAGTTLTINNGTFDIKGMNGYQDSTFNADTMSSKGIKASGSAEVEGDYDEKCNLIINGGDFAINTPDDAIHSDGNVTINAGTFEIYTGDDGVHADNILNLGTTNGKDRDAEVYIYSSYEGLEGATVNINSGKYFVNASDDGINSAGGSSNGTDPGNQFGRFGPGQGGNSSSSNYNIVMNGGDVYVNCDGDGLDANGNLYLYGGTAVVLAQETGFDNSPLDFDGTCVIKGATVFAAGGNSMGENPDTTSSQTVTYVGGSSGGGFGGPAGGFNQGGNNNSSTTYAAGSVITVNNGSSVVFNEVLTKKSDYILFSSPSVSSTVTFSTASSLDYSKTDAFKGTWTLTSTNKGTTSTTTDGSYTIYKVSEGSEVYTCTENNNTETKTIAASLNYVCNGHEEASASEDDNTEVYKANFYVTESGTAQVNVYYSQDYSAANESNVVEAYARDKTSGEMVTKDGQINFEVVCSDGYEVESVTVTPEGNYSNLKDSVSDPDSLSENMYRITKLTGDVIVNIKTKKVESSSTDNGNSSSDNQGTSSDNGSDSDTGSTSTGSENTSDSSSTSTESVTADGPEVGTKLAYKKYYYSVTKAGSSDGSIVGELMVTGLRKTSVTTIKIAANVTINGITYKVTSIKKNAFKSNKKVKKIFVGKNIKTIGNYAFANMTKVKAVSINSTVLTKIGVGAFMKDTKLAKVIIKSKKLKTIGKKAFFGDKKLSRITLKTTKLKTVGAKALYRKGGKKLTIKVVSSKKAAYKKLLKKAKTNKFVVK